MLKSLFYNDGNLVPRKDKYIILQELEKVYQQINFTTLIDENEKVIIFDGMTVVNRIDIQKEKGDFKNMSRFYRYIYENHYGRESRRMDFQKYVYDMKDMKNYLQNLKLAKVIPVEFRFNKG